MLHLARLSAWVTRGVGVYQPAHAHGQGGGGRALTLLHQLEAVEAGMGGGETVGGGK